MMARVERVVGRCYLCRRPVWNYEATHVPDRAVTGSTGRPIRRLAHYGACAEELQLRIDSPPVRGFEP